MLDQRQVREAPQATAPTRRAIQPAGLLLQTSNPKEAHRLTWIWSWSNARKPDGRSPPASRPIARAFGAARCFSDTPVARSATPITPGSHGKPGSTSRALGRGVMARAPWPDNPHRSLMIVKEGRHRPDVNLYPTARLAG